MKIKAISFVMLAVVTGFAWTASATVSDYIPVGGVLADLDGEPLEGDFEMTFALYDASDAVSAIWSETYTAVTIEDGLFTVYLGTVTALDFDALILADELWLGVTVGTDSEMDRIPLGTVPFAMEAYQCTYVGDLAAGDIQPILSGSNVCPSGTYFQGWDDVGLAPICVPDDTGYVVPGRAMPPSANTTTALVTADDVGQYPSITIGADGLGIIAYRNITSGAIEMAHCEDLSCTSATVSTLASAGTWSDIMIGTDGLPVVVVENSGSIYFYHCADAACTSSTEVEIQSGDSSRPAITIGSDGFPIMGFRWTGGSSGSLRTAHCDDVACSSFSTTNSVNNDFVNGYTTAALAADGMAVFSYQRWQSGDEDLMLAHCDDVDCTTATATTLTDINDPRSPVMTVGADGLPIIFYQYYWGGSVRFIHCSDAACTSLTDGFPSYTWGNTQASWDKYSITIGSDGRPFATLSAPNALPNHLLAVHCSDAACTTAGATTIETSGAGGVTSVTIGVDGNPLIAYHNTTDGDLMVTHCSTPTCIPYFHRR